MKKTTLKKKKGKIAKKKATKSKIKLTNRTKSVKKKKNVTKKSIKNALTRKAKLTAKLSKVKKTTDLPKKRKKILKQTLESKNKFEELIKDVVTKLIKKHKVSGHYTTRIVEKGIQKKYRTPENISRVENFLKKLINKGGLRCEILSDGKISVDDKILK